MFFIFLRNKDNMVLIRFIQVKSKLGKGRYICIPMAKMVCLEFHERMFTFKWSLSLGVMLAVKQMLALFGVCKCLATNPLHDPVEIDLKLLLTNLVLPVVLLCI